MTTSIQNDKVNNFLTILLSLFFCIPSINKIIVSLVPALGGVFMTGSFCFCILCFFLFVFLKKDSVKFNCYNVAISFLLIFVYAKTWSADVLSSVNPIQFFIYVIFPFLFFQSFSINVDLFIKTSIILPVFGVFFRDKIFIYTFLNAMEMGSAYAFLFPVICTFVYFLKIRPKSNFFSAIALLNFVYAYEILMHGSRGVILCFMFCLFVSFVFSPPKNVVGLKVSSYKLAFVALLLSLGVIFFYEILFYFDTLLQSYNIEIRAISKMLKMVQMDDLSNGRAYIQNLAINDFVENPWSGYGIATFEFFHPNLNYPHNFILQMLFDLGLIYSFPLVIVILRGLALWYKKCCNDEYVLFICLSASIPGALFSGDLWKNSLLWMALGFLVAFNTKNNKQETHKVIFYI